MTKLVVPAVLSNLLYDEFRYRTPGGRRRRARRAGARKTPPPAES